METSKPAFQFSINIITISVGILRGYPRGTYVFVPNDFTGLEITYLALKTRDAVLFSSNT